MQKTQRKGWFKSESEYNSAKQKMLKSVYLNGGFWVGRYEAGTEINRTKADEPITTASVTKADMYPYTYITRTQAKILAENSLSGNYTRSLMFGVQWDLMLKYIETKNSVLNCSYLAMERMLKKVKKLKKEETSCII